MKTDSSEPERPCEKDQELSLEALRRIDSACDQFEEAWRRGKRPRLQDLLEWCPVAEQQHLLEALTQLQAELAQKQKDKVAAAEPSSSESDPNDQRCSLPANQKHASQRDVLNNPNSVGCRFVFRINSGPHVGQQFVYDGRQTLVVGRSRLAHLRLADDLSFSRQHFQLEITTNSCLLTDLSSHNGTRVNGKRIKVRSLKDGDVIAVGLTEIQVSIVNPDAETEP